MYNKKMYIFRNFFSNYKGREYMKKILSVLSIVLLMSGCSIGKDMSNTPTKRVETYLNNYQTLNSNVLTKVDSIVNEEELFTDEQKSTYRDLIKKHYQDLTYTIKEETVNGDKATVETEIEVNDYTKVLKSAQSYRVTNEKEFLDTNGNFDESKFADYRLHLLKSSKDKVKYTIYFSLTKVDKEWKLDDLTNTEEEKILGIYEY